MVKYSNLGIALICVAVCGCGKAPQVKDPAPPTAAARPAMATEPGPQDADAPTDFTTTASGLKYRVLRKGSGPKPTKANQVLANYKGWIDDENKPFDSSYERGEPLPCSPAGGVIKGWMEGLTYVGEGGMIELEIPPDLGYGKEGFPPVIPPNATLHFIMEVVQVK